MMKRIMQVIVLTMLLAVSAVARGHVVGTAVFSQTVTTAGSNSTNKFSRVLASATMAVYCPTGTTTICAIYSDRAGSVKANPFTAGADGSYSFYTDATSVDIRVSNVAGITPFTMSDVPVFTPLAGVIQFFVGYPYDGTVVGTCVKPDGSLVSTSGTHTQGFKECITAANPPLPGIGYDFIAHGGQLGAAGSGPADAGGQNYIVACDDGFQIVWPAMEARTAYIGAITFYWPKTSTSTTNGMVFDSCEMCDIEFHGAQIYSTGRGWALQFKPTNPTPHDALTAIVASTFKLPIIVGDTNGNTSVHGGVLLFDSTAGAINGNTFSAPEINGIAGSSPNGTGGNICVEIADGLGWNDNTLNFREVHLCRDYLFRDGVSTGANNAGNTYNVDITQTPVGNTTVAGLASLGTSNWWHGNILMTEATADALQLISTAQNNTYEIPKLTGVIYQSANTHFNNRMPCTTEFAQGALSLTGSPYTTQPFLWPVTYTVVGGTVSAIDTEAAGSGAAFVSTGQTAGRFKLEVGEKIRLTYSGAPTVTAWGCNRTTR